jgi:apolipoprotein N-acyltransferase
MWWSGLALGALQALGKTKSLKSIAPGLALALSMAAITIYGETRISSLYPEASQAPKIKAAMIQANLDPMHDFLLNKLEVNVQEYRNLSHLVLESQSPQLLIWPESSVGYDYQLDIDDIEPLSPLDPLPNRHLPLLFGGQTRLSSYSSRPSFFNTAFLLSPRGKILGRYHKQILFPFSESWPLSDSISFLSKFENPRFELKAARKQASLQLPLRDETLKEPVKIATAICFEDMWGGVFFEQVYHDNARLLVALSNESWFADSVAVEQHLIVSSWRPIELGRFFLRSGNSGVTAMLDPLGRTTKRLKRNVKAGLVVEPALLQSSNTYVVFGRFKLFAVVVLSVDLALLRLLLGVRLIS